MHKLLLTYVVVGLLLCACSGQAQPAAADGADGQAAKRTGWRPHGHERRIEQFLAALKDKDPRRYTEMLRLKNTEPDRFYNEYRRYLVQARRGRQRRTDLSKQLAGRQELQELLQETELERILRGDNVSLETLVYELLMTDIDEMDDRHRTVDQKTYDLAKENHQAESAAEKNEIKAALLELLNESFDEKTEIHNEHLERLQKQINDASIILKIRQANKAVICNERLDYLLGDPKLRW